jgi:hypothetical protein
VQIETKSRSLEADSMPNPRLIAAILRLEHDGRQLLRNSMKTVLLLTYLRLESVVNRADHA